MTIPTRYTPPHCSKCGYDLAGNISGVCPECGTNVGCSHANARPAHPRPPRWRPGPNAVRVRACVRPRAGPRRISLAGREAGGLKSTAHVGALGLRSVFIHLWRTTEQEVAAAVARMYPAQARPWTVEVGGNPCLYIDFYRDGPVEDDERETRFSSRGGPPDVSVIADISGRHDGWPEVRDFVVEMLRCFEGVATDDDWLRLWSREEIENDQVVSGHRFGAWRGNGAKGHPE